MPVIIYLPGVTGYMQTGSFQTNALAANGYIVVNLNQPGAVAAALLPDGQTVKGLPREDAVSLAVIFHQVVHSGRIGETGVSTLQAIRSAPNEHP